MVETDAGEQFRKSKRSDEPKAGKLQDTSQV